jgi:glycerol uptake facilitator protein
MSATARAGKPAGWRTTPVGEYVSEFLGTFVLILFGDGVVAMAVAALNQSGRAETSHTIFLASGDWLLISLGWGFAVVMGVYVAGGVSGAHINPAVTFALAVRGKFAWVKVPGYWISQVLGAFVGAAVVYGNFFPAIDSYERVNHVKRGVITAGADSSLATYSIFSTFPAPFYHNWVGPVVSETIGTAILVGVIFAITDELNQPPRSNLAPFVVGLLVIAIGTSLGAPTGYAINPARDFGPRVFAWLAGYDSLALPGNYGWVDNYFWIPILAPLGGAVIGAFIYDFLIHDVLRARGETPPPGVEATGRTVEDVGGAPPEAGESARGRTVTE